MSREIDVCPRCNRADIVRRIHQQPRWYCNNCKEGFDTVARREAKTSHALTSRSTARMLEQMDPDEVPP